MCGIAGYCLNPKQHQVSNVADLAGQMLYDIEHRGQHATGSAWINALNGKRVIQKAPVSASKYVPAIGSKLCNNAQTAILHTRWATQGSPKDNNNNHPIPRGKIVLTHNGHISNDDALFKQLKVKRHGLVDSEAVSALLAFSEMHPTQVLPEVRGTASLAWIEAGSPQTLHLARVNSSPLWIGQTTKGSIVYGSTEETVDNASTMLDDELTWKHEAKEGEYFKITNGSIVEFETFKPHKESLAKYWNYRSHHWADDFWKDQEELAF